jgi:hypothetical protein
VEQNNEQIYRNCAYRHYRFSDVSQRTPSIVVFQTPERLKEKVVHSLSMISSHRPDASTDAWSDLPESVSG